MVGWATRCRGIYESRSQVVGNESMEIACSKESPSVLGHDAETKARLKA